MNVKVTNRNNVWKVRDRFGGIEYVFPPGETVTIPAEAAEHIFGYGLDERERFKKFMRMGIANMPEGKGQKMWDNIVIKPAGGVQATGAVRDAA